MQLYLDFRGKSRMIRIADCFDFLYKAHKNKSNFHNS